MSLTASLPELGNLRQILLTVPNLELYEPLVWKEPPCPEISASVIQILPTLFKLSSYEKKMRLWPDRLEVKLPPFFSINLNSGTYRTVLKLAVPSLEPCLEYYTLSTVPVSHYVENLSEPIYSLLASYLGITVQDLAEMIRSLPSEERQQVEEIASAGQELVEAMTRTVREVTGEVPDIKIYNCVHITYIPEVVEKRYGQHIFTTTEEDWHTASSWLVKQIEQLMEQLEKRVSTPLLVRLISNSLRITPLREANIILIYLPRYNILSLYKLSRTFSIVLKELASRLLRAFCRRLNDLVNEIHRVDSAVKKVLKEKRHTCLRSPWYKELAVLLERLDSALTGKK